MKVILKNGKVILNVILKNGKVILKNGKVILKNRKVILKNGKVILKIEITLKEGYLFIIINLVGRLF